ncbi:MULTISPECIES: hypothetical protein [unclassified Azospirillum]|jgi:hypothetical protein|uniref:hypothetical protein n=1 Tax=unclassified Azospirillum TaxID=2630922 RepID=UPI000B649D81|nr:MULTISPECIES: hypothetical protein [unclassified Azospirillum]SNS76969.1 hypothetical protein SAMN05880556_11171 [Azospirillum sp. RU38E]SNS94150.1 hypothetical protein SAMN05880591_11171 [Azospirillum sp. RU37A]
MIAGKMEQEVRLAATTHARLLDHFIQLTEEEAQKHSDGFTAESLQELLLVLRAERRTYGVASGVVEVMFPSIGNAA